MNKEESNWRIQEKWHLEVDKPEVGLYEVQLVDEAGALYKNARYVIDFRNGGLQAHAFGYFCKDWDLKLEAIELVKLYIDRDVVE